MFFDQGDTSPDAEKIRRRLNDLAAFRDDAHIASWAQHGIEGPAWDAFSHIWGDGVYGDPVQTAEQLAEKMAFHGFSAQQYGEHLQSIVAKGWLTEKDGVYTLTEAGTAVRQQAEEETDRLFFQSWPLSETELDELKSLMMELATAVSPPDRNALYERALDTRAAIGNLYGEKLQAEIQENGVPNWGLFLLMNAQTIQPTSLNSAFILEQIPYMNPATVETHLNETAQAGLLTKVDNGYQITEKGTQFVASALDSVANWINQQDVSAINSLNLINDLLQKISNAIQNAQEPQEKPAFASARLLTPTEDKPLLLRISRAISELAAFRDDVHVAAFKKHDIPAHEWEAFSHVWGVNIWGDKVNTAVDVTKKLAFRGFDESDYVAALEASREKGWLNKNEKQVYALTEKGKAIREEAEQETNRLFFAPWQFFAPRELNALHEGLKELNQALG